MNRKAIKLTRKSLFSCRIQKGRHCHRSHRQPHSGETWRKMRGRSRWWQSYSYTVHNGKTLCLVYERKRSLKMAGCWEKWPSELTSSILLEGSIYLGRFVRQCHRPSPFLCHTRVGNWLHCESYIALNPLFPRLFKEENHFLVNRVQCLVRWRLDFSAKTVPQI